MQYAVSTQPLRLRVRGEGGSGKKETYVRFEVELRAKVELGEEGRVE